MAVQLDAAVATARYELFEPLSIGLEWTAMMYLTGC